MLTIRAVRGPRVRRVASFWQPCMSWGDEGSVSESHRRRWRPTRKHWILVGVAGAVILAVGVGAVAFVASSGPTVPANTTVNGVDIGGLTRDEAVAKVREQVAKPAAQPLEFDNDGQVIIVKPRQAGVWVNAVETVEPLVTRNLNPFSRFFASEGVDVEPVIVVEEDKLNRQMGAFDRLVTTLAVESSLAVEGTTVEYTPGQQGRRVDEEAARTAIVTSILEPREKQDLPVIIEEPTVTVANADAANTFALAAVSGPVKVAAGSAVAEIPAEVIGDALTFVVVQDDYEPVLDGPTLYESIEDDLEGSEVPRDASFKVKKNGELKVVPSRAGGGVEDDDLAARVLTVLDQDVSDGGVREVVVTEGQRQPKFTTADARALDIQEKLSSFTQDFRYAAYRVTNIGQAAEYVNGTVLMPGDTFSMNDTILERTEENGYTEGTIIGPGGVFEEALGGGVSAATTAVWTAAFFAGMERASTRAHSVYISRYQPGLEATVAWGIFDMQFRNDSLYPVVITTDMTNSSMTVEFWGTKIYDEIDAEFGERNSVRKPKTIYRKKKDGCSPQSGIPGFTIDVDRVFYQNDEEVKRETIRSYYRAAPKVVCGKKPKKKDKDEDQADEGTPQDAPAQDAPAGDAPAGDAPAGNSDDATPATDDGTFENVPAEEVDVG